MSVPQSSKPLHSPHPAAVLSPQCRAQLAVVFEEVIGEGNHQEYPDVGRAYTFRPVRCGWAICCLCIIKHFEGILAKEDALVRQHW
jgi:hypothetical protein